MPDRKSLVSALWLTTSLALLASVLVAPIRTSGFFTVSSRPDCLRRNFALPPSQTTLLNVPPVGTNAGQILALETEEEERDEEQESDWILSNVLLRLAPPRSFSRVAYHGLVASHLTQAYFPLRC